MITDLEKEQSEEAIRSEKAAKAYMRLIEEIGALDESEITEKTAPFIAGVLAARHLEEHLLDVDDISQYRSPDSLSDRKQERWERGLTFDHFLILDEARRGNFSKLKGSVGIVANAWNEDAQEYKEGDPENQRLSQIGRNLGLIAERIPQAGDGSAIKVPNPANIEEPVPLRIQIDRFMKREAIR